MDSEHSLTCIRIYRRGFETIVEHISLSCHTLKLSPHEKFSRTCELGTTYRFSYHKSSKNVCILLTAAHPARSVLVA